MADCATDELQPPRPEHHSRPHGLAKLYISHTLTAWNSRMFEFGAVVFLAAIFPGTLFYASCYALIRSIAATLLSSHIGNLVDSTDRLTLIRRSIVWQRIPVAGSCGVFVLLAKLSPSGFITEMLFAVTVALACVEKLAAVGNTIAVERDWVVVIADSTTADLQALNATMRRIDLVCKLVAPVVISLVDGYSTLVAVYVILGQSILSVLIEYFAIAQVRSRQNFRQNVFVDRVGILFHPGAISSQRKKRIR